MNRFPRIPTFRIPDLPPLPIPWDPPWEGTLFHNSDTDTLSVKDSFGSSFRVPETLIELLGVSHKPSEPCRWCGHEFIPEGRRRVCANCGGPRERRDV
jgi:hypothetical protein